MVEDSTEERPGEVRAVGWYPVPDEPNYQRYWDGAAWTTHRYWGGEGAQPGAAAEEDREVREEEALDESINPRTPAAPIAVGLLVGAVILAFVVLDILPWGVLLVLVAVPLVLVALRWPPSRR